MANIIEINKKEIYMNTREKIQMLRDSTPKELLQKFGLDNKFPIDIRSLISKLEILIIPYDFFNLEKSDKYSQDVIKNGNILGAVVPTDDKIGVFYNKYASEKRIRFTLAHELAHCCLHIDPNNYTEHIEFRNTLFDKSPHEVAANIFAGELLIPEEPLLYALDNLITPTINILSKIFGVSNNVLRARLEYLDIEI